MISVINVGTDCEWNFNEVGVRNNDRKNSLGLVSNTYRQVIKVAKGLHMDDSEMTFQKVGDFDSVVSYNGCKNTSFRVVNNARNLNPILIPSETEEREEVVLVSVSDEYKILKFQLNCGEIRSTFHNGRKSQGCLISHAYGSQNFTFELYLKNLETGEFSVINIKRGSYTIDKEFNDKTISYMESLVKKYAKKNVNFKIRMVTLPTTVVICNAETCSGLSDYEIKEKFGLDMLEITDDTNFVFATEDYNSLRDAIETGVRNVVVCDMDIHYSLARELKLIYIFKVQDGKISCVKSN